VIADIDPENVTSNVAARRLGFTAGRTTSSAGKQATRYLIGRSGGFDRPASSTNHGSGSGLGTSRTAGTGGLVRWRIFVRITIIVLLVIALAACSGKPTGTVQRAATPLADGETITVRLSSFAFDPEQIRLKAGVPVRLRLVNESDGGHNFSAPTFFAASSFLTESSVPSEGTVEVDSHQTVEIALVPVVPGAYPLGCTHFLHSAFGMHGTVEVTP
jgi:plastocyanin